MWSMPTWSWTWPRSGAMPPRWPWTAPSTRSTWTIWSPSTTSATAATGRSPTITWPTTTSPCSRAFFPCGVWEAVYIVDGLLQQQSKAEPKEIHADTQGQSFPVFGLAYLFGFDLLPRIRNFKDRVFFRPDPEVTHTHIDGLFGEPINWKLIESHWEDLMRVAISIRQGKLSSVTLLRRLRHDSKRNKIYRAFRELGRVISTMVLLRYISDPVVRGHVSKATTMIESFNGFAKWLNFGNATIGTNDPEDQEKY